MEAGPPQAGEGEALRRDESYDSEAETPAPRAKGPARSGCGTSERHSRWLNWDPCGFICVAITWSIVLTATTTVFLAVIPGWLNGTLTGYVVMSMWCSLAFLGLASHTRAMTTNPGAVPSSAYAVDPNATHRQCGRCRSFKPPRAHHCSTCGRCIVKMDHHCPWVNNCVGLSNQKFFILFVGYIAAISAFFLLLVILRFFSCTLKLGQSWSGCDAKYSAGGIILVVLTVAMAILFGLFTTCMLCDQISSIIENRTAIDRLQERNGRVHYEAEESKNRLWDSLAEVFGGKPEEGFRFHWLVPSAIEYADFDQIAGFAVREPGQLSRANDNLDMV